MVKREAMVAVPAGFSLSVTRRGPARGVNTVSEADPGKMKRGV